MLPRSPRRCYVRGQSESQPTLIMKTFSQHCLLRVGVAVCRGALLAALVLTPAPRAACEAAESGPASATKDKPWVNSLGMKFVPVAGTEVLFSVWDTRVQDYAAFATATAREWKKTSFEQGPTHPAVNMSWNDAQAFAKWLTEKERTAGKLGAGQSYRLPADWEWSVAVGLNEARGGTPKEKDGKITNVYPWGAGFPPPRGAGNYAKSLNVDDFDNTSPVGSFAANKFGLFDMGGNVWQWCEDFHDGTGGRRVQRGGSWFYFTPQTLLSSYRNLSSPGIRYDTVGFRLVLLVGALL